MPKIKEVARKEIAHDNIEKLKEYTPRKLIERRRKVGQGVRVKGIDNIMVRFAKCCNPVPSDDIMGHVTRGRGVSIHRKDCLNLANTKDARSVGRSRMGCRKTYRFSGGSADQSYRS